MTSAPSLRLSYSAVSDVGRVRKDNQDSGYAGPHLLVVADGVGGAARGDIASHTAIGQLVVLDQASEPTDEPEDSTEDLLASVAGAIHRAHEKLAELVDAHPEIDGTSTTVTAARFDGHRVGIGHAGDSRAYLLRDGALSQLTKDHTFVQSLVDEGRITEDEARVHPHKNLILRAVDGARDTEPDLFTVDLLPGDRLMLCSDGACGVLDDERLAQLLGDGSPDSRALDIVRASLDAGSSDNVTVIVADVLDAATVDDPDTSAAAALGALTVGAAAVPTRKLLAGLGGGLGRGRLLGSMRRGDTGELPPVDDGIEDGPVGATETDPEEARYAPQPPRRLAWLRRLLVLAVVAVLVFAGARAAYGWTQHQYYVAPSGDKVAIYRGVQADVPFVQLNHVYRVTRIKVADLPSFYQGQVRGGMDTTGLDNANALVQRLGTAATCNHAASTTTPSATPSPTAKPRATSTPRRTKGGTSTRPRATASSRPRSTRTPAKSPTAKPTSTPTSGGTSAPNPQCQGTP